MKNKHYWLTGLCSVTLIAATSCVNNAYDLNDIDTTSRVCVKDLVIPMNIDDITLDQVLDIDDDSEVKKITQEDGSVIYAIDKGGTFKSTTIKLNEFTVSSPNIIPISSTLDLTDLRNAASYLGGIAAYYDITCTPTHFKSEADNVDESIYSVEKLGVSSKISTTIKIIGFSADVLNDVKIENLVVKYPKGLIATSDNNGVYDPVTGIITYKEALVPNSNGEIILNTTITGLDCTADNIKFNSTDHTFLFEDDITVESGRVNIYAEKKIPNQVTFKVIPFMDVIKVEDFTGSIVYNVDGVNIEPIDISNVPDLINQEGTSIRLANPQLYLSLNNPFEQYMATGDVMKLTTGISLISEREGFSQEFKIDNENGRFATDKTNINYMYVLATENPQKTYGNYINPQFVSFTSLSNVLDVNGKGVPTTIKVNIDNPVIEKTNIVGLKLGENIPAVEGNYTFYAPLQLNDNSQIKYVDTVDGWNDETVDKITINKLNITFDGSTEVPFDIEITVLPIDKSGKPIKNVTCNKVQIPAKAQNKHVDLTIEGLIKELDGIKIEATLVNKDSVTPLSPNMKLFIKNSKATVNGYYEDEL